MRALLRDAVVAVVLLHTSLAAQADPDTVKLRADCRLAVQILTTGEPGPLRMEALRTIGLCGSQAVPALVGVWSAAADNRAELGPLVTATRGFVTPELVSRLFSTLEQPDRARDARVAALMVLLTYADSSIIPGFADFLGDSTELLVHYYGPIDHPTPVVGSGSLPGPVLPRLRSTLQSIASGDTDPRMRVAARVALKNRPLRPTPP